MRAAVICEFNPFHNGHKFLLENMKTQGADEIICIMSGSFVQRGDIAVTDKYARAQAALLNGADMVVELPTVYAAASARVFAQNGAALARALCCDHLCFGAENSIKEIYNALERLDSDEVQQGIAARMKAGDYYPRALSESLGDRYAGLIAKPNNILALEYIRACRTNGIEPIAVQRKGADHNSAAVSGDIASATAIRGMILRGEDYTPYTPMRIARPASTAAVEPALLYRLKTMTADEIAALPDVSEGLENRIKKVASEYNSYSEICEHLKTKRYTMARLRRILICALLGITERMQQTPVPYIRVLGVKAEKKQLIRSCELPLIVDVKSGCERLDDSAKEIFDTDLRAAALMDLATGVTKNDFSHGIITV